MIETQVFKYPKFISIIFLIGFLFMTGIVVMMSYVLIRDGIDVSENDNWNIIAFNIVISFVLPVFLLTIGLISLNRLRYSFIEIKINVKNKLITSKQFKNEKTINFKDIISTNDFPNKSILVIKDKLKYIKIPKEIGGYSFLYGLLLDNRVLTEKKDFEDFETTIGLFSYIMGFALLPFIIIPIVIIGGLISEFDRSSNTIIGILFLSFLTLMLLFIFINSRTTYRITTEGIIKKHPFYKNTINYSNINDIYYNSMQRTLTLDLINDKYKWLKKIDGQEGIVIREPGNICIEQIYLEVKKNINNYRQQRL